METALSIALPTIRSKRSAWTPHAARTKTVMVTHTRRGGTWPDEKKLCNLATCVITNFQMHLSTNAFSLISSDHPKIIVREMSRITKTKIVAIETSLAVASSARPRAGTSTALVATGTLVLYFSSITLAHVLLKNACRPSGSRWNMVRDSLSKVLMKKTLSDNNILEK